MLSAVEVRDNSSCSPRKDRAAARALLEQTRFGLMATIVAREANPATLKLLRFQRFLDGKGPGINSQDVTIDSLPSLTRPFESSRSAADLVRLGFAVDGEAGRSFLAPDADVLVEEAFADGYCFSLTTSREHGSEVGLSFSPASKQKGYVGIDGTVWIDTAARAIRQVEYRYTGLSDDYNPFNPGGRVEFREMPTGSTLIDRRSIRLVALSQASTEFGGRPTFTTKYEVQESGGELAEAHWNDSTRWHAALGGLQIVGRTSAGLPAANVRYWLQHSDYRALSDSTGKIVLRDVLPGPYKVVVVDPELAKIDVFLDMQIPYVAARDSVHRVEIVPPTARDYADNLCRSARRGDAAIFLYVTDENGRRLGNTNVTEDSVTPHRPPAYDSQAFGGKTDVGGRYFSCWRFNAGQTVQFWVRPNGMPPMLTVTKLTGRVNAVRIVIPMEKH